MSHNTCIGLSFRFPCPHFCIHPAESVFGVSIPLCFSDITLLWQVSHRFLSLHSSLSVCLSARLCLSPSFSGVTPFSHYYQDSVPICRSLSEFPSIPVFPSPLLRRLMLLDVTEVVWTSLSVSISSLSLSCWCYFHQTDAGSEKAVHLAAGGEHHVPVNTIPLAMLSHPVPSFLSALLIFLKC